MPARTLLSCTLAASLCLAFHARAGTYEVNLYSYRQPFLIRPLLDAFTQETGIGVNVVFARQGMVEKIQAAGANNPADAVLTVDIGRLDALQQAELLEPLESETLHRHVPAHLRHPQGLWFGLTTRARVVWAHRQRVAPDEVRRLSDLTDPRFRGRICMRSGKNAYNLGLIAALIAHDGERAAAEWLRGVKANLARKPQGNDRAQATAIHAGVCDLALANHYYLGKMATNQEKPEQQEWAESLRVVFLDQDGRGQHLNISGAAAIRTGQNKAGAVRLLEFLAGEEAQRLYADENFEYPVREGVPPHPMLASWGAFKADELSLEEIARQRAAASRLVDEVGFDQGP
ncbi:MAG: Fe(3+) ABC transporter substrate-binding protein [Proteobacteria bacterium]|nr:Fe(3+) ABC transporter substrate-binding protein [Pseudomonadota bacterium]